MPASATPRPYALDRSSASAERAHPNAAARSLLANRLHHDWILLLAGRTRLYAA